MKEPTFIGDNCLSKEGLEFIQEQNMDCYAFPSKYKDKFEMMVFLLKEMNDKSNVGERFDIDEKLSAEIQRLLSSLCYLINSTSFQKGKYYDFDKQEIDRKLLRHKK